MAVIDYAEIAREKRKRENMVKLKAFIKDNYKGDILSDGVYLIDELEQTIKKHEETIHGYQNFFTQLGRLIPRQPSIHDVIC